MTKGAHIQLANVTHRYGARSAPALNAINVEIQPGEAVAMIGRSGCGKSTLLHIMAGLLSPSEGKVLIDGALVKDPSAKWIMMFQQPSLYPWMTVRQNAGLGLKFSRAPKAAWSKIDSLLEMVDLADFADARVTELSGGQQQRVALARSLATSPEVLLLDEPFSALDAFTRTSLQRDVRKIAKDLGLTLLIVTHHIDEAVLMADRVLVMTANPGEISEDVALTLPADRDSAPEAIQAERRRLTGIFEKAVNLTLSPEDDDLDHAGNAPKKTLLTSAA